MAKLNIALNPLVKSEHLMFHRLQKNYIEYGKMGHEISPTYEECQSVDFLIIEKPILRMGKISMITNP